MDTLLCSPLFHYRCDLNLHLSATSSLCLCFSLVKHHLPSASLCCVHCAYTLQVSFRTKRTSLAIIIPSVSLPASFSSYPSVRSLLARLTSVTTLISLLLLLLRQLLLPPTTMLPICHERRRGAWHRSATNWLLRMDFIIIR